MQSAYSGRGDRADPSTWPEVEGPLTVREIHKYLLLSSLYQMISNVQLLCLLLIGCRCLYWYNNCIIYIVTQLVSFANVDQ